MSSRQSLSPTGCSSHSRAKSAADGPAVGSPDWKKRLRQRLAAWFRRSARKLPWRGTNDPYLIWVSETMLQQTQVNTVIGYFERFVKAFPTIEALAQASELEVLRLWEGLGYYRRARQMHRAAQMICRMHAGRLPADTSAIRALPGIGRYTAGAILSIAFDQPQPILEANTLRVFSRLLAYRGDPRRAAGLRLLWRTAEEWLPRRGAGLFNQALMELGSEICFPRAPACDRCPVALLCPTRALGLQHAIPPPAARPKTEAVREATVAIRRHGKVLLLRRGDTERWAGLWDFPRFPLTARRGAAIEKELIERVCEVYGLVIQPVRRIATLKHGVTRFRITLECYEARYVAMNGRHGLDGARRRASIAAAQRRWVKIDELGDYPLSVTGRKLARLLAESKTPSRQR